MLPNRLKKLKHAGSHKRYERTSDGDYVTAFCSGCGIEFIVCRGALGQYCSNVCQREHAYTIWVTQIEKVGAFNPVRQPRYRHRRYLLEKQNATCAICGRKTWLGQPIALVFDHINGQSNDWRIENCRLICNNCDAQQPTFKGANRGQGRKYRQNAGVTQ